MTTPNVLYFSPADRDTPDVSLDLPHLRALLTAANQQLSDAEITPQQHDTASWLILDSLRLLAKIENELSPTATN